MPHLAGGGAHAPLLRPALEDLPNDDDAQDDHRRRQVRQGALHPHAPAAAAPGEAPRNAPLAQGLWNDQGPAPVVQRQQPRPRDWGQGNARVAAERQRRRHAALHINPDNVIGQRLRPRP